MNNHKKTPDLKGRNFNGTPYAKIKRVREEPCHKIQQRSFIPLNRSESEAETVHKSEP